MSCSLCKDDALSYDVVVNTISLKEKIDTNGYRLFISSTMDDLGEEPRKIAFEAMKSENIPIMAENMIDVINTPRKDLEEKIDECDGYIGIFHKKRGYVPTTSNPDKLSITAIEYERARKRKIAQLVLIKPLA